MLHLVTIALTTVLLVLDLCLCVQQIGVSSIADTILRNQLEICFLPSRCGIEHSSLHITSYPTFLHAPEKKSKTASRTIHKTSFGPFQLSRWPRLKFTHPRHSDPCVNTCKCSCCTVSVVHKRPSRRAGSINNSNSLSQLGKETFSVASVLSARLDSLTP